MRLGKILQVFAQSAGSFTIVTAPKNQSHNDLKFIIVRCRAVVAGKPHVHHCYELINKGGVKQRIENLVGRQVLVVLFPIEAATIQQ